MASAVSTRTACKQLQRASRLASRCPNTAPSRSARRCTCRQLTTSATQPYRQPLRQTQRARMTPQQTHSYYTAASPEEAPYSSMETAILSAAMEHVPTHGFTHISLAQGAQDAGYLTASTNLLPRGPFELVLYHLATQRLALKHSVQFPVPSTTGAIDQKPLGTTQKVRTLLLARLLANESIRDKLPEALGLMSLAGNIPASLRELGLLSDEIWYLAGDVSVDSSWYTKRGLLSGVYASSEVFMSQDTSPNFKETESFVDRRLEDVARVGGAANDVGEWLSFTGAATVNVLRSWGVRI